MTIREVDSQLWRGERAPEVGALGKLMTDHGAEVVVGHPTYGNVETIGPLLAGGIAAAKSAFGARPVTFIVSDGTMSSASRDGRTIDAALEAAREAVAGLAPEDRSLVQVVATPYEGYGGDSTPGKGSALKMIFDEMGRSAASLLLLFDGDLRNDMARWYPVFAAVEAHHAEAHPGRPMFVTARYARHFVDASLTRFIVGPLTTLMGTYVPGGISGDIGLSASAVAKEREAEWAAARRRYGTDISTTFDNIADPATVIYEVYLGAKLHDITDEAKLSAMPAQVIGAALERLQYWEREDGRVTRVLEGDEPLGRVESWGSERTGIDFVDPGATDVFDVDVKVTGLIKRFDEFHDDLVAVMGPGRAEDLWRRVEALRTSYTEGSASRPLRFLGVSREEWVAMLQQAVGYALATGDLAAAGRALNYLYTAAFLEFVKDRLADLGVETLQGVREVQGALGVPEAEAPSFYRDRVDAEAEALALRFYATRRRVLDAMADLSGAS